MNQKVDQLLKSEQRYMMLFITLQNLLYFFVVLLYWGTAESFWLTVLFVLAFIVNYQIGKTMNQSKDRSIFSIVLCTLNIIISFLMIALTGHKDGPFMPMYYIPSITFAAMSLDKVNHGRIIWVTTLATVLTGVNMYLSNATQIEWIKAGVFAISYFTVGYSGMFFQIRITQMTTYMKIDYLTNLYNKQAGEEILKERIQDAKKKKEPVSICFCDIDDFKKVNDKYGHLFGDFVLKNVSTIIKKSTPESTSVIRWGGDELLILFKGFNKVESCEIMEAIRKRLELEKHAFEETELKVTISGGIVEAEDFNYEVWKILREADRLLYSSKDLGKNQIKCV